MVFLPPPVVTVTPNTEWVIASLRVRIAKASTLFLHALSVSRSPPHFWFLLWVYIGHFQLLIVSSLQLHSFPLQTEEQNSKWHFTRLPLATFCRTWCSAFTVVAFLCLWLCVSHCMLCFICYSFLYSAGISWKAVSLVQIKA